MIREPRKSHWRTMEMLDDKGVIGGSDRQCRVIAVVGCPRVREL